MTPYSLTESLLESLELPLVVAPAASDFIEAFFCNQTIQKRTARTNHPNMHKNAFLINLLLIGGCLAEGGGPPGALPRGGSASKVATESIKGEYTAEVPEPLPREGYIAAAVATQSIQKQRQHTRKKGGFHPIQALGGKIQQDAINLGKHIGYEWDKLTSIISRKNKPKCKKLDEVCHTFASVQRGNHVDTAQLLKACRAHLTLMKSGGAALRLVAKDLEGNVQKAERAFKKNHKDGKSLSSLLEIERESGIHNGNELHEKSAAMGLLWIRRSLAFQLDLYNSLIHGGVHPRDAAYDAYWEHLSPFHGWALRKVFPASLQGMPDRHVFIAKFGESL